MEEKMIRRTALKSTLCLLATYLLSQSPLSAAEGIISKVSDSSGSFCHLKFPAIREDTLSWNRPVLKALGEGDIIDFYGPCDYDPLGKEEVQRQKREAQRERNNQIDGDA
jgi:hypothetical protein